MVNAGSFLKVCNQKRHKMRNLLVLCLMLLLGVATKAQVCNNGPFPGHNFGFSEPFTLPNGNMGVRVIYRNSSLAPGEFVTTTALAIVVKTNSCGGCGEIQGAWSTIFNGLPNLYVTVEPDHRTATFFWFGFWSGQKMEIFNGDPIMILDMGDYTCATKNCFDLWLYDTDMIANGVTLLDNEIGRCEREICKPGTNPNSCTANYGAGGMIPSPYARPTVAAGDDFVGNGGQRFSRVQYWDPSVDPFGSNTGTERCIAAMKFTITVSGDLQIVGATCPQLPGAVISFTSDQVDVSYSGAPVFLSSSDVLCLLQFANNAGCGTINICSIRTFACGLEPLPLIIGTCPRTLCIGAGKMGEEVLAPTESNGFDIIAFPNPFSDETEVRFELPAAGAAHFKVFSTAGQLIFKASQSCVEGSNSFKFVPTQEMAAGIYYYTLETSQGVSRGKLLRQ
jgi:hypothetical protein